MINNNTYEINNTTKIVLYGAATIGTILFDKYKKWNLNVIAFIDKRAEEIRELISLPVYDIDNNILDKNNCVIIVAVKNVFEHSRIAMKLKNAGYKKIIFRPYNALNNNGAEEEMKLNNVYSSITENDNFDLNIYKNIPFATDCLKVKLLERGIIEKNTSFVKFYLPITMLYKDKREPDIERQHSILCLKPHINFAKYIIGLGGEKESLISFCISKANEIGTVKITNAWKENVIENQSEIYLDMLHKYNIEPDFFNNISIQVIWNKENKYFNLNSGKHRASFLCAIGKNYIPVQTTIEDYESYLNYMDVNKLIENISEKYEDGYAYPVENPYLYDIARYSENSYFNILRKICDNLSLWYYDNGKILSKLKIYDELDETQFFDSFFNRSGYEVSLEKDVRYDVAILTDNGNKNNIKADHYLVFNNRILEAAK